MTDDKPTYQELEQRISLLEQELRDKNERLSLSQEKAHESERNIQDINSNFETFFNTIDDFLFVIDEQGNILHCNNTVEKRLGYTVEELKGKSILSVHPEDRRSETASVSVDVIVGKLASFQIPLVTKQGKQIFVETHAKQGVWNGRPAFFGVSKDITKLKLSEEKFATLFRSSPDTIMLSRLSDGVIIEVNDSACINLGYTKEELIGKSTLQLNIWVNPEDRKQYVELLTKNHRVNNFEAKFKMKSGQIKVGLMSSEIIQLFNDVYILGITRDITDRKKAEEEIVQKNTEYYNLNEELAESLERIQRINTQLEKAKEEAEENEQKFSIAFHSSPSVSMITNIDTGEIIEANDAVHHFAGFSREETIGKSVNDLNLWMIEGAREKFVDMLVRDKKVLNLESTFRKKSGESFVGLISAQMIRIKNQDCLLSVIHDITDRKSAEIELLKAKEKVDESKEKFKNLYESLSISYLTLKDGVCIECNEATLSIYGAASKDEIIGKSPISFAPEFQFNHEKSSKEAKRHNQTAIEEGFHTFEWLAQRKNKEAFFAEVSLKRYYYKNELYIQCLTTDITERKRIEAELIAAKEHSAENESFLRTLINTLPDLVWLKDVNGVYLTCNKRLGDFLGIPEHKIIGKTDNDFVSANLADFFRQSDIEAINAGKPITNEELISIASNNHSEYLETIKTPFYRNGELIGILGIGRNITERKNAELELLKAKEKVEESEEKFKNLYESLSIAYLIIKDGTCVECNRAALEIYGIESKDEIIGKPPTEFSPEYQPNKEKSVDEAIRQTEIAFKTGFHTFEWLGMRKNKELFYNEVSLKKFYYKNELYLQCLTTDITERKRIENELIAAKEKAEESDRLKTAFLQNMSHEIRTPLNAISGFSGLLTEPDITEEDINRFVQIIQINTGQLISIVNDILTISSLETKQVSSNISNVCINEIIDELLAVFEQQASKRNISLYAKHPLNDQQSEIETDKTKIFQILSNLLANALKFTHEGFIEFGYLLKGNKLEFYVKDSGIGIKQEFHGKIFERFRQGDKSINKLYGGTGLGLAISKAFVELLGGKIWVQSEFGKGSTFYFTLPYKPANRVN